MAAKNNVFIVTLANQQSATTYHRVQSCRSNDCFWASFAVRGSNGALILLLAAFVLSARRDRVLRLCMEV
jgi:hypothetical protein